MNVNEAIEWAASARKFGRRPGLSRMKALMRLLGDPQDRLKFVHIAGTNGKGSTAAYVSTVLTRAGYRTGLFTSPYIYCFNERIRLNGENIPDNALAVSMERVKIAVAQMCAQGLEHPTEFELITAAGFDYFACQNCDIVILEVGLGGRFDATNIIRAPLLAVITLIGLDHTAILGDTVDKIAYEKCGIIKPGAVVISYARQPQAAREVIRKVCDQQGCLLVECDPASLTVHSCELSGSRFSYRGETYALRLCGRYQIQNAVTALNILFQLQSQGFAIRREDIREGLLQTFWPGRFETILQNPLLIADGSHNIDGIRAFVQTVKECLSGRSVICVFGMLSTKNYKAALAEVADIADVLIATQVLHPHAVPAETLAAEAKALLPNVYCCPQIGAAVQKAVSLCGDNSVIFAVGSLYMTGDIRREAFGMADVKPESHFTY